MRPFEIILLFTVTLPALAGTIPRFRGLRVVSGPVYFAVSIVLVQILVEGARWQMAPAYILTGLLFVIRLRQRFSQTRGIRNRTLLSRFVPTVAFLLAVAGLGISFALPLVFPVFQFPRPGGPYAIGTVTYHWTDVRRPEIFSTDRTARRELMAQVWYPARKDSVRSRAPYLPDAEAVGKSLARLHNFPAFSLLHLSYVKTNAGDSVPVATDQPRYPVLIFLEGLTGYRQMNTFQVEELVSYGYIIVGLDQPGAAATVVFPDGHQIAGLSKKQMEPLTQQSIHPGKQPPLWKGKAYREGLIPYFAGDVSFVLDKLVLINKSDPQGILSGKLDLARTGMFGVSYGGIVGAEACRIDPRLKACLVMDVYLSATVVQKGLRQPTMLITRDAETMRLERQKAGGWTEEDIEQTLGTMRAVYNSLPGDGYFVQIPGVFHIDLTDLTYVSPLFPIIGFSGPVGGRRSHTIIDAYSVAFYEKHLNGADPALLSAKSDRFPGVIFNTRKP